MRKQIKYWWLRVWTYRKSKFKLVVNNGFDMYLGVILKTIGHDGNYIDYTYIGKGYFIQLKQ